MTHHFNVLKECPLFRGISEHDLYVMLDCLHAKVTCFDKGETVIAEGSPARFVGIVLSGSVHIIQDDYFGNRSIVAQIGPAELFGESFACAGATSIPVSAVASKHTEVMLVDCTKITHSCSKACLFHHQMIYNLLKIVAQKNLVFHQKVEITSHRTTRAKLLAFLSLQAKEKQSDSFEISYDRQELADFLGVERSGLSAEIGKLCREGIIQTERKKFKLMKDIEY